MKQRILYVGLDVDDTQYHGSALSQETGEVLNFRCRPTLKGLVRELDKLCTHFAGHTVHVAYEASYIGYSLQRDLAGQGYHCDVVGLIANVVYGKVRRPSLQPGHHREMQPPRSRLSDALRRLTGATVSGRSYTA